MADVDDWDSDGGGADRASAAGAGTPGIQGGLLDSTTFPARRDPAVTDSPAVDRSAPEITGPLMTDPHAEVLQDILNAQAKLPPVAPHPETWSVSGQPYLAIGARTYDPTLSSGVTSMPTPADSAAAVAGMSRVAVRNGNEERAGYIAHSPSRVVPVQGKPGGGDAADTLSYARPAGFPIIHGHIDDVSNGMVDDPPASKGYGDTWSHLESSGADGDGFTWEGRMACHG